jgi:hypothetical protein
MFTPSLSSLSGFAILLPAVLAAPRAQDLGQDLSRRAASCAVKGYDNGVDAFYYDGSGKEATYALCSARCQKTANCVSFGFGRKVCMLFNVVVYVHFQPVRPYMID